MSELIIPNDRRVFPTLGPGICELMEEALLFGPGDLFGKPYRLDEEDQALIYSAYEVYPRGHKLAGQRCYDAVVWVMAKGTKKSERAAAIAAMELHPDAPVRFDHWQGRVPVGRPVASPYVPIVAYTEKQAEDTSFAKLYWMLRGTDENPGPHAGHFDIGLERIVRLSDNGKAEALSAAPDARDGGLTTFQIEEEGHRWTLPRQHEAHATMSANLTKRPIAEPWALLPSTSYRPGEGSVIEELHDEAVLLASKPVEEQRAARMFFFYRWADERIKIRDAEGAFLPEALSDAVHDAIGPVAAAWKGPDRLAREVIKLERIEPGYGERVILNRAVKAGDAAFDAIAWKKLALANHEVPAKAAITLGGDGSKVDDATAVIATEIATGYQWPIGIWDPRDYGGRVPVQDVMVAIDLTFEAYRVVRFYFDPPYWTEEIAILQGRYGEKVVMKWETWRPHPMGMLIRNYASAIASPDQLHHDGDKAFTAHIGNARKRWLTVKDNEGQRLFTIQKERDGSPHKIDAAAAGSLSWQARTDCIAAGIGKPPRVVTMKDLEFGYLPI